MGLNLRVNTKAKIEESLKNNKDVLEEYLEPISPTSAIFLHHIEELPICILAFFESEIPANVAAMHVFHKDHFLATSTRFSSIMIEDKEGKKLWKTVDVNVQNHVKVPIFPEGLSPENNYDQHVDDYISKIAKETLPVERPLWEFHIITYPTSHAAATFIFKFHHLIADGFSLMGAVFSGLRRADDPLIPLTFPSARPRDLKQTKKNTFNFVSVVTGFISSTFNSCCDFGEGVRRTISQDDRSPIRSGNADLSSRSVRVCTVSFSLNEVKRIKTLLRVTVNDVVVGTIFLATQLYKKETDPGLKKARSTALLPINARSIKACAHINEMHKDNTKVPWGNKIQVLQLPISNLDPENPLKFVKEAQRIIKTKRTSFGQFLMAKLLDAISTYGSLKFAAKIFYGIVKNATLVISNMIGPIEQMSLANHPLNGFYFMLVGLKLVRARTKDKEVVYNTG